MGQERKPFHESVIDSIRRASLFELQGVIGPQLMRTDIPKGHDAIIMAWKERCTELKDLGSVTTTDEVVASLEEQKQEAARKEAEKAAAGPAATHVEKSIA